MSRWSEPGQRAPRQRGQGSLQNVFTGSDAGTFMIDPANPDYANTPAHPRRATIGYALEDIHAAPQVSIVTPFHDTDDVFHETARSVLRQSFQQWEWLIVNDASTNAASLAMLAGYRCMDARIRVIDHDTNRGPAAARNTGFRESRAPYVVQLDSDNLLEPTAIEKWLWFLASYPEHAFVKGYTVGFGAQSYLMRGGFHEGRAFTRKNRVDATALVRASVHRDVSGYDESIRSGLEDWEFWLRCANAGRWGGTVPEFLDWFRRRPSHTDRWPNWDEGERQRRFHDLLRERYPHLWNGGWPRFAQPSAVNAAIPCDVPFDNRLRKDRRRLLLVVPWLSTGGADNFNLSLIRQLAERGWDVTVIATLADRHPGLGRFARLTSDIFILPNFLRLEDAPRFLHYLIRSRQPDAILTTNSELGYRILPLLRASAPDIPILDYCHVEEPWGEGGYPRVSIECGPYLDAQIVTSEHLARWMVEHGAARKKVRVCTINVDTNEWRADRLERRFVRHELGIDGATPIILFGGRLCAQKQPRVLARTLDLLRERGTNFVALIAGDGPEMHRLRTFVRRRRLDGQVRLLGEVEPGRMRELMQAADIFFLPSRWEGIALSFFEAMSCGVPVVGADVGGQSELVTPTCGVLLPSADPGTEANAYATVLAELCNDPSRRAVMSRAARARVRQRFPLERMGDRMVDLIDEAIAHSRMLPRRNPTVAVARHQVQCALAEIRARDGFTDPIQAVDPLEGMPTRGHWRARVYRTLFRWHEPVFHWYVARGWTWIHPVRRAVRKVLLRFATES